MRAFCAIVLITLTLCANWAFAEPNFPSLTGRVVDSANILDAATHAQLSSELEAHEATSSNQIVVATVGSLEGYDIADYGVQLARHWGIGTHEKSNGVLVLVAPNERKVRIEVGYGLEGALPDGLAGDIIRKRILPSFRENDYPAGIKAGVSSVIAAVDGEYEYTPSSRTSDKSSGLHALVPIIFIGIIFISEIARRKFNNRRVARAAMPGGFVGMMVLIISNNPFIGIAAGIGLFAFIYLMNKNTGAKGQAGNNTNHQGGRRHHGVHSDRYHGRGHGGSGGGFSGGGGGFGGGGASGGW